VKRKRIANGSAPDVIGGFGQRSLRFLALVMLLVSTDVPAHALERLEPPEGCYLGVNLGDTDTVSRLNSRLGFVPAVYVGFFEFPLTGRGRGRLDDFLDQVRPTGGIALVTLEPFLGLAAIAEADCADLGDLCAIQEARGIGGIMVRFAHEMNGNWYPWCQKPILYKEKFRLLAERVRPRTGRTALVWAPAYGGGYPFAAGGLYQATPGTPDFMVLDTDGDGRLSQRDDMYGPFYPGDDVVDWVGMTLYHWGFSYPWLENELPEPNSFAAQLTGNYSGGNGDQTALPDFYASYCADGVHDKPLVIPETAAFFNTNQPGPGELAIKRAWWRQVFNISGDRPEAVDVATRFPKLKCVNWFDHLKPEAEARGQWIDWRISAWAPVRSAFIDEIRALRDGRPWFLTAQDFECSQQPSCIKDDGLPAILPLTGSVAVGLIVKVHPECDLVVDLLDQQFQWQGGTRAPVTAGTTALMLSFLLIKPLVAGATYRWSIFLTPPGGDVSGAFASYKGPSPIARRITPAIKIVGFPPVVTSPSAFTVRIKCAAADSMIAVVDLFDGANKRLGGGSHRVRTGDSLLDVAVSLPTGVTDGDCALSAFLSDSPSNRQNPVARSPAVPLRVAARVERDLIDAMAEPELLPAGELFRFTVSYAAVTERDLHLDLFTADRVFLTSALQLVSPGSGVRDIVICYPNAPAGEYVVTAFITPSGNEWTQPQDWSDERRIRVVEREHLQGEEFHWSLLRRADADANGSVEITDAISVLAFLFLGGQPLPCDDAGDANDDGGIDVTDSVVILNFLFTGGTRPPAPGPHDCGPDLTPSSLGVCVYEACR